MGQRYSLAQPFLALMELVFNTRGTPTHARGRSLKTKWICPEEGGEAATISFIGIALQKIYYSLQPSNYKPCRKNNGERKKLPATATTIATATNLCLHRQIRKERNRRQNIENKRSSKSYGLTTCCRASSVCTIGWRKIYFNNIK